jgi:hypothetical protein
MILLDSTRGSMCLTHRSTVLAWRSLHVSGHEGAARAMQRRTCQCSRAGHPRAAAHGARSGLDGTSEHVRGLRDKMGQTGEAAETHLSHCMARFLGIIDGRHHQYRPSMPCAHSRDEVRMNVAFTAQHMPGMEKCRMCVQSVPRCFFVRQLLCHPYCDACVSLHHGVPKGAACARRTPAAGRRPVPW